MARNLSAMKYHRQSERRRTIHLSQKTMIRTFSKKAVEAAESGDAEAATKFAKVAQGLIDKAQKTSTLHKNTAARKKSRLAKQIRNLQQTS